MIILIRLLIAALIVYLVYRAIRDIFPSSSGFSGGSKKSLGAGSGFKCEFCRHCGALYEDGAMCHYGDKKTFKNPVHIENCMDYERNS